MCVADGARRSDVTQTKGSTLHASDCTRLTHGYQGGCDTAKGEQKCRTQPQLRTEGTCNPLGEGWETVACEMQVRSSKTPLGREGAVWEGPAAFLIHTGPSPTQEKWLKIKTLKMLL